MKKSFAAVITLVMLFTVMSVNLVHAASQSEISDNFDYISTGIKWDDSSLTINGYFINSNQEVDIFEITKFNLNIYDSNGKQVVSGSSEDKVMKNLVIPSNCTVTHTFTITNVNLKKSNFDFSKGYTSSISCNFVYANCDGKNCTTCKNWRNYQYTPDVNNDNGGTVNPTTPTTTEQFIGYQPEKMIPCSKCNGTLKIECTICDGTGKNAYAGGFGTLLAYLGNMCLACDGNGNIECYNAHDENGKIINPKYNDYTPNAIKMILASGKTRLRLGPDTNDYGELYDCTYIGCDRGKIGCGACFGTGTERRLYLDPDTYNPKTGMMQSKYGDFTCSVCSGTKKITCILCRGYTKALRIVKSTGPN